MLRKRKIAGVITIEVPALTNVNGEKQRTESFVDSALTIKLMKTKVLDQARCSGVA